MSTETESATVHPMFPKEASYIQNFLRGIMSRDEETARQRFRRHLKNNAREGFETIIFEGDSIVETIPAERKYFLEQTKLRAKIRWNKKRRRK